MYRSRLPQETAVRCNPNSLALNVSPHTVSSKTNRVIPATDLPVPNFDSLIIPKNDNRRWHGASFKGFKPRCKSNQLQELIPNSNAIIISRNSNEEDDDDVSSMGSVASEDSDRFYLCLPSQLRDEEQQNKKVPSSILPPCSGTQAKFLSSANDRDKDRHSQSSWWYPNSVPPSISASSDSMFGSRSTTIRLTPKTPTQDGLRTPFFPSNPSEVPQNNKKRSFGFFISS